MESSSALRKYLLVCANASDSNVTSELWLVGDRTSGLVTAVFLLLFLVIGLPLNLLVTITIVKERLYTQPTIILLLNLVIMDLILLVFHLPLVIVTGFNGEYFFGSSDSVRCSVCSNTGFVSLLCSVNAIFTIALMSIDRFLFIYKPLHYDRYITKWKTVVAIAVAWLVAVTICIFLWTELGNIVYSGPNFSCDVHLGGRFVIFLLIVVCFAILPVIVFNVWLCGIVQKNIRAIYKVKGSTLPDSKAYQCMKKKRHEKEKHLYLVFGALLCSNITIWLPIIVVSLIHVSGSTASQVGSVAAQILFLSQVTVHPIIETMLLKDVRVPLLKILCCCCDGVMAKLLSDQGKGQVGGSRIGHNNSIPQDTAAVASEKCYTCDFLDTCGVAVLFLHIRNSRDTENEVPVSEKL